MSAIAAAEISDYMFRLEHALRYLPVAERQDLMREISAHFEDALANGDTPAAIIARMGAVDQVAAELTNERLALIDRYRSPLAIALIAAKSVFVPFLVGIAGLLALNLTFLLHALGGLLRRGNASVSTTLMVLVLNTPMMILLSMPIAMLFAGLTGLPSLAERLSQARYRHVLPRFIAGVLAAGILVSLLGFAITDVLVPPASRGFGTLIRRELLHQVPPRQDSFSPMELSLAELGAQIRRERTASGNISAPAEKAAAMQNIDALETVYHLKLAIPAISFGTAALGLALGMVIGRRRRKAFRTTAMVIIALAAVGTTQILIQVGLDTAPVIGSPWLAAWLPVMSLTAVAACLGAIERLVCHKAVNNA